MEFKLNLDYCEVALNFMEIYRSSVMYVLLPRFFNEIFEFHSLFFFVQISEWCKFIIQPSSFVSSLVYIIFKFLTFYLDCI